MFSQGFFLVLFLFFVFFSCNISLVLNSYFCWFRLVAPRSYIVTPYTDVK